MNIRRIMKEYYEQCWVCKSQKLDEMEQLSKRHIQPKLTQGEIDDLNRPHYESIINNLPKLKAPVANRCTTCIYVCAYTFKVLGTVNNYFKCFIKRIIALIIIII